MRTHRHDEAESLFAIPRTRLKKSTPCVKTTSVCPRVHQSMTQYQRRNCQISISSVQISLYKFVTKREFLKSQLSDGHTTLTGASELLALFKLLDRLGWKSIRKILMQCRLVAVSFLLIGAVKAILHYGWHFASIFYIFRPIWITFGTRDIHKNVLRDRLVKIGRAKAKLSSWQQRNFNPYSPWSLCDFDEIRHKRSVHNVP